MNQDLASKLTQDAAYLLGSILDNSLFGVYLVNENQFLYTNQRMAELLGREPQEILSRCQPIELLHPEDREQARQRIRQRLNGHSTFSRHQLRLIRGDGTIVPLEIYSGVSRFAGEPAILGLAHDISEQMAMERAVANQLFFISKLLETIPSPVFYKDEFGRYQGCNAAFEHYIGLSRAQLVGKSVYDISPKPLADVYQAADQALFQSRGEQHYEAEVTSADGTRHNVVFNKAVFDKADGSLGGLVGVILDITERKRMEDELRQSQASLLQNQQLLAERVAEQTHDLLRAKEIADSANRAKSEFLSRIGHDLRTPMNDICRMTEVLLHGCQDEQQRFCLSKLQSASATLNALIDSMLDYVSVGGSDGVLDESPFDLTQLVGDAVRSYQTLAEAKCLRLEALLDPDFPRCIIGDAGRWRQIVCVLLDNAIKFSPAGRIDVMLEVSAASGQRFGLLTVHDTGIGIAPENQARIFEPFIQEDAARVRGAGGNGLGLALARKLVQKMSGNISVESIPRIGSTFTVRVPLRECAP